MPRTPLARMVRSLFRDSRRSALLNMPVDELLERREEGAASRRAFLGTMGQAAIVAAGASSLGGMALASTSRRNARIAIVGAGLGGLTCAWRLKQAGFNTTIYESKAAFVPFPQ